MPVSCNHQQGGRSSESSFTSGTQCFSDVLNSFQLTHAERANYETVILKFKESWILYKFICFHKSLQHMVYMFLNRGKRKKRTK